MDSPKGQVIVYKNKVEVRLEKETVWLTQKRMAELFDVNIPAISKHLNNIFEEGELQKEATVSILEIVQNESGRNVKRKLEFYNLDTIIAVGYRVNSKKATQFRIWATNVLKQHLVNGYTINEKRLKSAQHKYQELQKSLKLLGNVIQIEAVSSETKGLIRVITEYSHALDILDDFDHERLSVPKGTKRSKFKITYEEARKIIEAMKQKFKDSAFVGQEKDESFKSSIETIYQTFGGTYLYPTTESKAAHLLYFVTKNHSFVDGNKRIAAALFICFLQGNGLLVRKDGDKRIDDNTLVALTLMIAASKASEKETIIKVILNLLGCKKKK